MSISEDKGHSDRGVSISEDKGHSDRGVSVGVSISVIRIGVCLWVYL